MNPSIAPSPCPVVHAVPGAWLPQTQTWLYDQVRFLPPSITSRIVCDRLENLDQFPIPDLHATRTAPMLARGVDDFLHRLHARRHRGLLAPALAASEAAVLHSHFGPEGWRNHAFARRRGVRHLVTFYGYDVNCLPRAAKWRRRYDALFDAVDGVLCEGEHMASCVVAIGCPREKVRVQRLGVDTEAIPFRPRTWNGREPLRVLLAAAFREKKGLSVAIDAMGPVSRNIDVRLTIVGDATSAAGSAEEKARILAGIERHGLADRVNMRGFVSRTELNDLAADHHLFVAPSRTARDGDTEGGAPVALIEMAASGMPIVSTRHCDIPGVVRHGRTGFLARENDAEDLRDQIHAMLDHAPGWPAMLAAGRRHIARYFDAAKQGERLATVYRALAVRGHLPAHRDAVKRSSSPPPAGAVSEAA